MKDIASIVRELDSVEIYAESEIAGLSDSEQAANSPTANTLINQYEQVVVRSLITSFGLDGILFHDKAGGDVDTLETVRTEGIAYASKTNEAAYMNRGAYDSHSVHSDAGYISRNRELSALKKSGNLTDAYTGQKFAPNAKTDLDHVISAKEIHDEPARVLAGLSTEELANTPDNLYMTSSSINRSKNAYSASEFMDRPGSKRYGVDGRRLMARDKASRAAYNRRLAGAYYTSSGFLKSATGAALNSGVKMGIRQAVGLVLTEVWCSVREDFARIAESFRNFELGEFLHRISDSFKRAFKRAGEKFGHLISSFKDGLLSGVLASVSTTLINMFAATAKNIARVLRECFSSLLQAFKILFLNPDNLSWAERFRAVAKVIAVSVSVILGGLVQEAVSKMSVGIPVLGDVLPVFVGTLVSGILSVSLIYFLDRSEIFRKVAEFLESFFKSGFERTVEFFRDVNIRLDKYMAELAKIDYATFAREIVSVSEINARIYAAKSELELNTVLHAVVKERGISLPYEDLAGLDKFMLDPNTRLVF